MGREVRGAQLHVLDRLVRRAFGSSAVDAFVDTGSVYRSPTTGEAPAALVRRVVEVLPVRLLGVGLLGELEIALDGLRFVPLRGRPRSVDLAAGTAALDLGRLSFVADPAGHRLPRDPSVDGDAELDEHDTVRAVQMLATSVGFAGNLDVRPHPERFLPDAAEWGGGDDVTYTGGFVALGRDRLLFFSSGHSSWAAAAARDFPHLGSLDHRHDLLRRALEWLTDDAYAAVLERSRREQVSSYLRDDVGLTETLSDGRVTIDHALDLRLSPEESDRLKVWLAQART